MPTTPVRPAVCRLPLCRLSSALAVFLCVFGAAATPAAAQDQPGVEATGLSSSRAYVSVLPWESIDAYSGSLVLTFTDLVLPGNAGFDLRVTRVFNSKKGAGWRIGPGFVKQAEDATSGAHVGESPTIVSADGAEHLTFRADATSSVYRTLAYGRYDRSTHRLSLPDGVTYEYDCSWNPDAANDNYPNARYPTAVHDAHGNAITFDYQPGACGSSQANPPKLTKIVQALGNGVREVTFSYQGERIHTITYRGRTWTYNWTPGDDRQLLSVVPPAGGSWQYAYDGGQVSQVTTPNGGQVTYLYGTMGRGSSHVVRERRSLGVRGVPEGLWSFSYDGNTGTVTSPLNQTVYTFYTSGAFEGTPTRRETKDGGTVVESEVLTWGDGARVGLDDHHAEDVRYAYGPLLTARVVARDGHSWATTYEYSDADFKDYGQPWRIVEGGDFARTTEREFWDSSSQYIRRRVSKVTVSGGGESRETSFEHDVDGFVFGKTVYGVPTTYVQGAFGNLESETDAKHHTTYYLSYRWGAPEQISSPEHTVYRVMNEDGTVQSERRDVYRREFVHDVLGRETNRALRWTRGGDVDNPTATSYAVNGSSVTTTRGSSSTTTTLDGFGRATGTSNAVGVHTHVRYNAWGGRSYEGYPYSDNADIGSDIAYDALGRVKRRTNPDGTFVGYEYDGLTVTITDEKNRQTVQTWQASGEPGRARLASVRDANGKTTSYTYDILNALTGVAHPDGSTRQWHYNDKHQLESESHPESGTTLYVLDAVGNVEQSTDAEGRVLRYGYDGENRLIDIKVGPPNSAATRDDVHFAYDSWGNRYVVENAYVSRVFTFEADRLLETVDSVRPNGSGGWTSYTTSYGYDDNDNVTSVRYPAGARRTIRYEYDAGNRITLVYEEGGPTYASGFSYHPSGAVSGYTSGNGIVNSITHDDRHQRYWPSEITAGSVLALTYTYDDVGNVASVDGAPSGNQSFLYDNLDRLTSASGPWGTETYTYDDVGNRTWKDRSTGTEYHHVNNRLKSATGVDAETFAYDNVGNLTGDRLGTYAYTPFDMLETATMFSEVTPTYRYDGDHLRTISTVTGVDRYSLHGPGSLMLTELKSEGGTTTWVRDYIYAGTRLIASVRQVRTTAVLTVAKSGHGAGTVTGTVDGAGVPIACGATCTATYQVGRTVTLTATPTPTSDGDSKFTGWSGSCSGSAPTITVTIGEEDLDCRARFIVPKVLTVGREGRGSGTVTVTDLDTNQAVKPDPTTGTWELDIRTRVRLAASPADGSVFVRWSGDCAGSDPTPTLTMTAAKGCVAKFVPVHWLSVTKAGAGAGLVTVTSDPAGLLNRRISCGGTCAIQYPEETRVTLSVGQHTGVTFLGWSGAGCAPALEDPTHALAEMDQARTCEAAFKVTYPKQLPGNGTTGVGTSVVLTWSAPMPEVGNWVCWDATNNGTCDHPQGWLPNGTLTSREVTGLLPGTTYYWQVRTTLPEPDNSQPEANDGVWWQFTTAGSPPLTKQSPANGAAGLGTTVTVQWTTALTDPGFLVCLDTTDPGPTAPDTCAAGWRQNGAATSRVLEGLAAGVYYWQVKAAAGPVYGDNGTRWSFRVGAAPPPLPAEFTKTTPVAEAVSVATPVTLSWGASAGATHYEYCVDTNSLQPCNGVTASWHAAEGILTATVSDLAPSTPYVWQVRAWNSTGHVAATDGWRTFTTAAPAAPPGAFAKTAPGAGAPNQARPVTLTWGASSGAASYEYCVDTISNGTCDGMWLDVGSALTVSLTELAASTSYSWQVRAKYSGGAVEATDGWWTFTTAVPPATVTKQSPTNGATGQPSAVTLQWTTTLTNPGFWVCYDTTANGTCDTTWWPNGAATTRVLTGLAAGTTYSWQVKTSDGTVYGDNGTWWSFTTAAAPPPIAKLAPTNGSPQGGTVTLQWTTTLTDPGFWVCWDGTNNGACDTMWWPNGAGLSRVIGGLSPGTYYWQVKSGDGTLYADAGTWWSFTVAGAPEAASEPAVIAAAGEPRDGSRSGATGAVGWPLTRPVQATLSAVDGWGLGALLAVGLVVARRRPRADGCNRAARRSWVTWLLAVVLCLAGRGVAEGQTTGTAVEYYHLDALGSVRVVTNAARAVLRRHDFKPFGEEVNVTYPNPDRKLFTGHERDTETALDYFGARYYRSDLGRFTNPDPGGFSALHLVNPQRFNAYASANGNPLSFVDPDGRDAAYVNFSQMAHGFGHAGILSVHADGTATYTRSGPEVPGSAYGKNVVRTTSDLPKLAFDSAGLPTDASLHQLGLAVALFEQADPSTVSIAYFKTSPSETAALDTYIQQSTKLSQEGALPMYRVIGNSCLDHAVGGLSAAGQIGWLGRNAMSDSPNEALRFLRLWADLFREQISQKPKPTVTTSWCVKGSPGCR